MRGIYMVLVAIGFLVAQAPGKVLYQSGFSNPPYDPASGYWAGVDGWFSNYPDNGSVAVSSDGGYVYVGNVDPGGGDLVAAGRYLSFRPLKSHKPIVTIETSMILADSTNSAYDPFAIALYNRAGEFLGALYLDNYSLHWYLDNGAGPLMLSAKFPNNTPLSLEWRLDFSTNLASASMKVAGTRTLLFQNVKFHAQGETLDLGQFHFLWLANTSGVRGDNLLFIDSLSIRAEALAKMKILGGLTQGTRASGHRIKGRIDPAASMTVQARIGASEWTTVRQSHGRWSCRISNLAMGKNVVRLRTLNARRRPVEQARVKIVRR